MAITYYKGFSTRNYENNGGSFALTEIALIEEDLQNQIFTSQGERVMMPSYGTRIPELIFELNNPDSQQVLLDDLTMVFNSDPRVKLLGITVIPAEDRNALIAVATINYIEFNVTKDLRIQVNSR
jgi:phage baseplate assembly protein W